MAILYKKIKYSATIYEINKVSIFMWNCNEIRKSDYRLLAKLILEYVSKETKGSSLELPFIIMGTLLGTPIDTVLAASPFSRLYAVSRRCEVETKGFEPSTLRMRTVRSPN